MGSRVVVLRHGETHGYFGDVGLTEVGEEQARAAGALWAGALPGASRVAVRHAPTARGTATAAALREALVAGLDGAVPVGELEPDHRFDSLQFLLDGQGVESTNAAAARGRRADEGRRPPDWVAEYDRFDADQGPSSRAGGPIDRWMTSTTRYFEPPQVAVYRLWAGVVGYAADLVDGEVGLAVGHSGPMRAFTAAAFGADLGEPENLAPVEVLLDGTTATVTYDGRSTEVDVPDAVPPWIDPGYLAGARAARPLP